MTGEIIRDIFDRKFGLDKDGNVIVDTGGKIGVKGAAFTATAVVATDGANKTKVTITVKDVHGIAIAFPLNLDIWLSDAATGAGLTAVTASGAVAAGASGADLGDFTAKKAKRVQTSAAGVYELSITDTAKTTFYVCAAIAGGTIVLAHLATGNYG